MATSNWWYVKRKGRSDLGPMTHREARAAALEIAKAAGTTPELQQRTPGQPTKRVTPHFPELRR